MWSEGLGRRFVVPFAQVPLGGFEESVEPFVLPCVAVALVVRHL